jgi:hypothetical protein
MTERKRDVSGKAYQINGILRTCILACDPMSTIAEWNGDDGIERTLEVAEKMMGELIDEIEALERAAGSATA